MTRKGTHHADRSCPTPVGSKAVTTLMHLDMSEMKAGCDDARIASTPMPITRTHVSYE